MKISDEKRKAREKAQCYRQRLRMRGLRTLQLWVPDTRRSGFAEDARRQSLAAAAATSEQEVLDFMEALEKVDWLSEEVPSTGEERK